MSVGGHDAAGKVMRYRIESVTLLTFTSL